MSELAVPFTISANPGTDLWRKPPTTDDNNAPSRIKSKKPLLDFQSASISFSTAYTVQFDQAGILLRLTHPGRPDSKPRWIKAGVEFFDGQPRLSVVCCDRWADWSVASIDESKDDILHGRKPVSIKVKRDDTTIWVHYVDGQGKETPLREIAWVFGEDGGEGWELEIGALVARPNKDVKEPLEAKFHSLEDSWTS